VCFRGIRFSLRGSPIGLGAVLEEQRSFERLEEITDSWHHFSRSAEGKQSTVVNAIYIQTMVTERNERTRAESSDSLQYENPGATDDPVHKAFYSFHILMPLGSAGAVHLVAGEQEGKVLTQNRGEMAKVPSVIPLPPSVYPALIPQV